MDYCILQQCALYFLVRPGFQDLPPLEAMWTVYQADGAIVSGLADRNGQRYSIAGTGKNTVEKDMGWVKAGVMEVMHEKQQITMRWFLIK